ncbi:glycoside hydrolase [Xylariomycetidae sp. FL0641]|nr:glycoside hydrolase [Xylariomycetidae sp. FL0641]
MAIRRVRIILAVIAIWILGSLYYTWEKDAALKDYSSPAPPSPQTHTQSQPQPQPGKAVPNGELRWKVLPPKYPVKTFASLPTSAVAKPIPRVQAKRPQESAAQKKERLARLDAVRDSFTHSWQGYKRHAWGHDEIKPISGEFKDPFGGWAATLVDSLDSLWLMDMKDEFEAAVTACKDIDFTTTATRDINVFETTIRYLGGFVAAYELSEKQYPLLLDKAIEVAELLMTAFDTPNHMPISRFPWKDYMNGKDMKPSRSVLVAEIGSLGLELTKMSQLTGDLQYWDAAKRIYDELERGQMESRLPGVWPVVVDASKSPIEFTGDTFSLGGMADSVFEYLGKQHLLLGGMSDQPRRLYDGFIDVAEKHLLRRALHPDNIPISFFGDVHMSRTPDGESYESVMTPRAQHLTCFTGGMVGMAAKIFDRPADLEVAAQLTDGCVWSYNATTTGIGPEIFHFIPCAPDKKKDDCQWSKARWYDALRERYGSKSMRDKTRKLSDEQVEEIIEEKRLPPGMVDVNDRRYLLRPEAIESVFMMYRMTGDSKWMDRAWDMFSAVEGLSRTNFAAAALDDITLKQPEQVDSMESFWLAETLKYFYLIFADWELADLDKWVLNTEAHPLKRADA